VSPTCHMFIFFLSPFLRFPRRHRTSPRRRGWWRVAHLPRVRARVLLGGSTTSTSTSTSRRSSFTSPRHGRTRGQGKPRPVNQAKMSRDAATPADRHHAPAAAESLSDSERARTSIFYCSITDITIHRYCSRSTLLPRNGVNYKCLLTVHKHIARAISSF
jgi:hypothetical protein